MTPKEIKECFQHACDYKGFIGTPEQARTWGMFGFTEKRDLLAAIDLYYETELTLPMPAQLRPLVERFRRERVNKTSAKKTLVMWRCSCCGCICSAFLADLTNLDRRCKSIYGPVGSRQSLPPGQICGALMQGEAYPDEERTA